MKTKRETLEKKEWGPGPWQKEPDRVEFEYLGFPCLLRRNMHVSGSWCGYVAVPPSHPAYKKDYSSLDVGVHGGLTYSDHCRGDICHIPKPGEPDDVWWVGFDCAHFQDFPPLSAAVLKTVTQRESFFDMFGTYKDLKYVKAETKSLAKQLAALR